MALPPPRLRPDTRLEHQDLVSQMAQKKREKERMKERKRVNEKEIDWRILVAADVRKAIRKGDGEKWLKR